MKNEFRFIEWVSARDWKVAPHEVWHNLPYAFREHDGFTDEATDVVALLYKDWKSTGKVALSKYGVDEAIWGVVDTSIDAEDIAEVNAMTEAVIASLEAFMPKWFEVEYEPSLA